jgi:DNA polymerase III epsilon subunit-like protein
MGLLTLLFALGSTISETIKENAESRRALEERRRYEDIDWGNIEYVTLDCTETAYRIKEEEEFDIVATNFLSEMDGWQHYETKTVEYEVEDGENYCFTIRYKNGTEIYRKFHETSSLTERLLEYCNNNNVSSEVSAVMDAVNNVVSEIGNMFNSGNSDYETAFLNFKQMQSLYGLNENSTQEDFEKAAEVKMTSVIMSNTIDFNQSIYELMLYLLSTEEDGDILEKTDKDELSFLQQTDNGIDAFVILEKGKNADNRIVMQYDKTRIRNGYRKAIILTTGSNTATISNPDIVIWDIKKICVAYISAFKKVVSEKSPEEKPEAPKERFAVIDFETTGLNYDFRHPPMDEIISVAIIDQDENVLLDTYCDTVKIKSWYEAQCINGISPRDVKGCPTFLEIMPKVIEILSSYDYVISYNVPFEKFFLENYARLYTPTDFSIHKIKWGEDPMEMFMDHMNSHRFLNLETAAKHFGYSYNAHNALGDAKAALYVYKALRGK